MLEQKMQRNIFAVFQFQKNFFFLSVLVLLYIFYCKFFHFQSEIDILLPYSLHRPAPPPHSLPFHHALSNLKSTFEDSKNWLENFCFFFLFIAKLRNLQKQNFIWSLQYPPNSNEYYISIIHSITYAQKKAKSLNKCTKSKKISPKVFNKNFEKFRISKIQKIPKNNNFSSKLFAPNFRRKSFKILQFLNF